MKRKSNRAAEIAGWILGIVALLALVALGIWLRNTIPCDWMPLKDAPPRCLTGVVR